MSTFRKLRIRIFLLLLVVFAIHVQLAYSQFTNVSAVVQDSNGNLYTGCSYSVDYVYSPGSSQNPLLSGSPFQMSYGGAKCDSFAAFSIRLPDNNSITPSGSQWRFSICDSTGTKCFTSTITITGANQVITSTLSAVAPINVPTGGSATPASKGFLSVMTDCGNVKGDGVTADGAVIQACINAHPGRRIIFPKTQAVGTCDYNINGVTILPKGHGQILEGEGAGWGGTNSNTTLCKTIEDGLPGMDILGNNCQNCTIKNLKVTGPSPWASSVISQNIPPCNPPEGITYAAGVTCVTGGDGIKVEAPFTNLENLYVDNWGHHGVYTTSEFGNAADNFNYINVSTVGNRGDGYYCKGGDCNAGSTLQFHAYTNQMYGMDEHSFLGNAHNSPQMTANHPTGVGAGGTFASTAIRTANVVTLTATGHNFSVGNVIVVAGMSDGTFNGTFSLSAVTTNTVTYPQTAGNSTATGGTARLTSNNEYFAFTGLTGGAYNNVGASAWNTYFSPYCEGSQNPFIAGGHTVIIGGDQGCGIDYTNNPLVIGNGVAGSPVAGPNFLSGGAGFAFATPTDSGSLLMNWTAGKTIDQTVQHRFIGGHSLTNFFEWVMNPANGTTNASLALWRLGNGQKRRIAFNPPSVGGDTQIDSEGGMVRFDTGGFGGGYVQFTSGGAAPVQTILTNPSGQTDFTPQTNGQDTINIKRFTDSSPTGNFLNFKNAANTPVATIDITGKQTVDAGLTTASFGHPIIVASVAQLGQTATIGPLNLLASAPIGMYQILPYFASTTTCATPGPGNARTTVAWTDENGTAQSMIKDEALGLLNVNVGSVFSFSPIVPQNGTNITYTITYTACTTGTGTYSSRLILTRLQ